MSPRRLSCAMATPFWRFFSPLLWRSAPMRVNRPLDPVLCPQKNNDRNSVQRLDNVNITIYDPDPSTRVEHRGLIWHTFIGSTVAVKVPWRNDCKDPRQRHNWPAPAGNPRTKTVAPNSTFASADEVDARPGSTLSSTRPALFRFHT